MTWKLCEPVQLCILHAVDIMLVYAWVVADLDASLQLQQVAKAVMTRLYKRIYDAIKSISGLHYVDMTAVHVSCHLVMNSSGRKGA